MILDHASIILEALGRGPASLAMLACELHKRAGIHETQMYREAKSTVDQMVLIGDIEYWQHPDSPGNSCYRLSGKTQIELSRIPKEAVAATGSTTSEKGK